jgi:hypothetical protein
MIFYSFEKIKHGFKTLAECRGIHGVDDTSSQFCCNPLAVGWGHNIFHQKEKIHKKSCMLDKRKPFH